jgi:predicted NAD-dependent protein-ADP-ribosyltransferase YbiA (DUF1768 family)
MSQESPVIAPFRPLEMLRERPEPVVYNQKKEFADASAEGLPISQLVVNELDEHKALDRQSILDRLMTNGFLVKACTDSPATPDAIESLTPNRHVEPVASLLDLMSDDEEDGEAADLAPTSVSSAKGRKLGSIHVQLEGPTEKDLDDAPAKEMALPKEPKYDGTMANPYDKNTVFVLCSSKTEVKVPGKEPSEKIPKDRVSEFVALGRISQWRDQLCDSHEAPFQLDDVTWQNVDHYVLAARYRQLAAKEAFTVYENAVAIHKSKKLGDQKIKEDSDFSERERQERFHALYAKFSQYPEMLRVLEATRDAHLMYRVNKQKKVDALELMWLRETLRPYVHTTLKPLTEEALVPVLKRKAKKTAKEYDLSNIQLGEYATQLPHYTPDVVKASSYYMNNRTQFIERINKLFRTYGDDGKTPSDTFDLLSHQKVVRDYLDIVTPYRGLLVYHNLGTGKSCTSIAVTEGMKNTKRIVIMVPASLKKNYEFELQKCGDLLYRNNQHWQFVSTDGQPQLIPVLAKALGMSPHEVEANHGAWMVNVNKPPNFKNLAPDDQRIVRDQIHRMIHEKYTFLHYNANNLGTKISQLKKTSKNPFDHTTVVIDEAHNLISNMVGNIKAKNKDSVYTKLYDLLMDAVDLKVVALSGTPIINYPQEISVLFNVLRGYIYTWTFKLQVKTSEKVDTDYIRNLLDKHNCVVYDFLEYTRNTLVITRNPYGFVNVNERAPKRQTQRVIKAPRKTVRKGQKGGFGSHGVKLDDKGNISNDEFKKQIIGILKQYDLVVEGNPKVEKAKCLPDDEKTFQSTFLRETTQYADKNDTTSDVQHVQTLRRRILGLTSYFRSPNEALLPDFVLNDNGSPFHEVRVPMSDYQVADYAKVRKKELEKERKAKTLKGLQKKVNNQELFQVASSYRVFSRTMCNFAFPIPPGRPFPTFKAGKEETEADADGITIDTETEEKPESNIQNENEYAKKIESAMNYLRDNRDDVLSTKSLSQYSPKMLEILRRLKHSDHEGLHLLYSNFVTMEGIGIFQEVLHANGFQEFKVKKVGGEWALDFEDDDRMTYALYTGQEDPDAREVVRNVYNGDWENVPDSIALELRRRAENNQYGQIIKLFMITAAGAEGINLKNTRYVHIMEPYWHNVRLEQVIGRARRIKSHMTLPEEMRTVQVFLYMSVLSEEHKKDEKFKEIQIHDLSKLRENHPVTTDEYLYEIAQMKQKVNGQFLRIIKETAMDCHLYVQKHKKHEPLVCYGRGFAPGRDFVSYPTLKMDLEEDANRPEKIRPQEKAAPPQEAEEEDEEDLEEEPPQETEDEPAENIKETSISLKMPSKSAPTKPSTKIESIEL